ncbi:MAG: response regulator transcription factor [Peptococcaceae bacterium]|nr:response regulator transcription factor [Peptococcaceae bacterium]
MPVRILIADDEPLARDELIYLLTKIGGIEVVGEASTGEDTINKARETCPDTIFLDIQMPKLNGLEVAKIISHWSNPPLIVFATAYDEHAIKAFEVNAIDYVLKPFEEDRVLMTVERIKSRSAQGELFRQDLNLFLTQLLDGNSLLTKNKINKIMVQEGEAFVFLNPEEIVYIAREGRDVFVKTNTCQYESRYTLQDLELKLTKYGFQRTHRAFIVNLNYIDQLVPWFNGAYTLIMKDMKRSKIPVSRSYIKSLRDVLGII